MIVEENKEEDDEDDYEDIKNKDDKLN